HSDKSDAKDLLYVTASFKDPAGRSVEIRSAGVLLEEGCERFGGVCSNLYCLEEDRWSFHPLRAWARFEVRIDGLLADADLQGSVVVSERLDGGTAAPALTIALRPKRAGIDLAEGSPPLEAAGAFGGAGWLLHWEDVTFHQAPVLSVRAERGDTLAKI